MSFWPFGTQGKDLWHLTQKHEHCKSAPLTFASFTWTSIWPHDHNGKNKEMLTWLNSDLSRISIFVKPTRPAWTSCSSPSWSTSIGQNEGCRPFFHCKWSEKKLFKFHDNHFQLPLLTLHLLIQPQIEHHRLLPALPALEVNIITIIILTKRTMTSNIMLNEVGREFQCGLKICLWKFTNFIFDY